MAASTTLLITYSKSDVVFVCLRGSFSSKQNVRPFIKNSQSGITKDYTECHNLAQADPLVQSMMFYEGFQILRSPCLGTVAGK